MPQFVTLQSSYDAVADEYVSRIYDELRHKPLDRELLDRLANRVKGTGLVCDVGCGPGHVARYLHDRGVEVCGVDLSTAMIERARQLNPRIPFERADMRSLDVPDASWVAATAFYSLIHIPRDEMVTTLRELHRVLKPSGELLVAFHLGTQTLHLDEWWGHVVDIDFHFFTTDEMKSWFEQAGFTVEDITERDPYPDVEHASRRGYLTAIR